ncbi:MAG: DEAD/DEAH box helicase family protein [Nitrososphaera sp.]
MGKPMPMFDYEKRIFLEMERRGKWPGKSKDKHVWIKKATGLGITEFFLRYMAWLCYFSANYRNAQMCIVTGPNIELAKGLIKRLREICEPIEGRIVSTETSVILNDCKIEAYPSHHLDAMRSLPNPGFIFLDEADFFPPREQKNARNISERYIAKSDPYIVMVSTPNMPGGLYDSIEKEPEEKCIYRRLHLPYTIGLNKIYSEEEIKRAKASPSFEREYNLEYGFGIGDIFPSPFVDACLSNYDLRLSEKSTKVLGVDPGYGSSKFAIVGLEDLDEIMYVKEAKEYDRPSPSAMLEIIAELARDYQTVAVDSAHPGLIRDLKERGVSAQAINFGKQLSAMTSLAAKSVKERRIRIHPAFSELTHQLKAVTFNEKGHPDKKKLSFDLGDALMAAIYYMVGGDHLFVAKG